MRVNSFHPETLRRQLYTTHFKEMYTVPVYSPQETQHDAQRIMVWHGDPEFTYEMVYRQSITNSLCLAESGPFSQCHWGQVRGSPG